MWNKRYILRLNRVKRALAGKQKETEPKLNKQSVNKSYLIPRAVL